MGIEAVFFTTAVLVPLALVGLVAKLRSTTNAVFAEAARRLGLQHDPGDWRRSPQLTGQVAGVHIAVRRVAGEEDELAEVRARHPGLGRFTVRRRRAWSGLRAAWGREEIVLGDEPFDRELVVFGDPVAARAALRASNRKRLVAGLRGGVNLEAGVVSARDGRALYRSGELIELVERCVQLTLALGDGPEHPAERLLEGLRSEPVAGVRRAARDQLRASYPEHPATAEAEGVVATWRAGERGALAVVDGHAGGGTLATQQGELAVAEAQERAAALDPAGDRDLALSATSRATTSPATPRCPSGRTARRAARRARG